MQLVQKGACDGRCCQYSPRFPTDDRRAQCQYFDASLVTTKFPGFCKLLAGVTAESTLPNNDASAVLPDRSSLQTFRDTCRDWPANTRPGKDLGDCCWAWIDE